MPDEVKLLVRSDDGTVGLIVFLSSRRRHLVLSESERREVVSLGVSLVSPGRYDTACGKGYWDCGPDEPAVLTLDAPAVRLFTNEGAESFFIWKTAEQAFQQIWMSD